jgi:hypothetical protein
MIGAEVPCGVANRKGRLGGHTCSDLGNTIVFGPVIERRRGSELRVLRDST